MAPSPAPHHPRDAVIVQAIRTPLCRARKGGLAEIPPSALLSTVLHGVLLQHPQQAKANAGRDDYLLPPDAVQDVCVGNVLSPPTAAVAFRMAALSAGLPHTTSLSTVNRQCSSGLQAIANVAHAIKCGSIDVGIGAGVESMSANPMHKLYENHPPEVDWDAMQSCGNAKEVMDCLIPMGKTSENVSKCELYAKGRGVRRIWGGFARWRRRRRRSSVPFGRSRLPEVARIPRLLHINRVAQ